MSVRLLIALCCGLFLYSCTTPTGNEPDPEPVIEETYLSVEARPEAIPADGVSKMVIFTEYRLDGAPAPDSTRIVLLNTIGTLQLGELYTLDGIAIDTLTADTTVSLGMIYAVVSGLRDSVEIAFEPLP